MSPFIDRPIIRTVIGCPLNKHYIQCKTCIYHLGHNENETIISCSATRKTK